MPKYPISRRDDKKWDWRKYNELLVMRGEILFNEIENWERELSRGRRGRRYKYPNSFILLLAYIHILFHLRQLVCEEVGKIC
ncbi:MAG: hypothetical protein JZD40_01100 [Sulfolobus sp.]|nr:hypothetical protein [Sulfolobus sp.]